MVLLDVSRLVWRAWARRLPTGIDRVCLAYARHFADRACAVVQHDGRRYVLGRRLSRQVFSALLAGGRWPLAALVPRFAIDRLAGPGIAGAFLINVGHTGLDDAGLPDWIASHGLRPVYMVHDLIPITHPQFCRPGEPEKHRARLRNLLGTAAGVIGNSRATLDELTAFAAVEALPVPPSLTAWIAGFDAIAPARGVAAPSPCFVAVGTIEGRKNHLLLLRIWRRLAARRGAAPPRLVLVGQRGWQADAAFALLDAVDRTLVDERPSCGDVELAELLAGAYALLMPSFAEGFGLPVIEALQRGVPVIASDLPALREIAGGIPTFLDPDDDDAWYAAITAFVGNGSERRRQLAAMADYRAPDWPGHFARVERWLGGLG